MEVAGYLPQFLDENDPRPAVEQIHTAYGHSGGWSDFAGFKLVSEENGFYSLSYPDDPPTRELSRATLRDEKVILFQHSWVAVIQPDGSFRVARID